MANHGDDPCLLPLVNPPDESGGAGSSAPRGSRHPGSAKLRHRNLKIQAWKSLHAAKRPLTRDEEVKLIDHADAEWEEIKKDPVREASWKRWNRDAADASRAAPPPLADDSAPARAEWTPLWGQRPEHRAHPLEMTALAADLQELANPPSAAAASQLRLQEQLLISKPRPRTALRTEPSGGGWPDIVGCACQEMKNICRRHGVLREHELQELEGLTARLNSWVGALGRKRVDQVESFVLLRNKSDARDCSIFMLSDARFGGAGGRAQMYACCSLRGREETRYSIPDVPFDIRVRSSAGACRLGGTWRNLWFKTSDELALSLVRTCPGDQWAIIPLTTVPALDTNSLLDEVVTGCHDEFIPARRAPKVRPPGLLRAEQEVLRLARGGTYERPSDEGALEDSDEEMGALEGAFEGALEESDEDIDCGSDVAVAFEDAEAFVAEADAESSGVDDDVDVDGSPLELHGDGEAGDHGDSGVELATASPAPPSPAEAARNCTIEAGEVRCTLSPWCDWGVLGIYETLPREEPPERRNKHSLRCQLHKHSCNVLRSMNKWSLDQMLLWLCSGEFPCPNSRGERLRLSALHRGSFEEVAGPPLDDC